MWGMEGGGTQIGRLGFPGGCFVVGGWPVFLVGTCCESTNVSDGGQKWWDGKRGLEASQIGDRAPDTAEV